MNINEFLATEVMGWRRKKGHHDTNGPILHAHYIDPANKDFWLDAHDWNPTENIEQAMMCLEQIDSHKGYVEIFRGKSGWPWSVRFRPNDEYVGDESLPMAISLACARAAGWKE